MTDKVVPLASDLLRGTKKIAEFLGLTPRQTYHLIEKKELPVFKMGGQNCARASVILAHIEAQERDSVGG